MDEEDTVRGHDGIAAGVPSYRFASPLWALAALLAGLLLTAELARREWKVEHQKVESLQRSLADAAPQRLRESLENTALVLRSMQTVFLSSSQPMDQAAFTDYQRNLRSGDWLHGYVLTGFASRETAPDDGRGIYRYLFLAPLQGSEALLGFDIASQPENMDALLRARDADTPALSAPFPLLQFRDRQGQAALGVTVRLPAYTRGPAPTTLAERQARELGALAVSLRLEPMVGNALKGSILDHMHVDIRDAGAAPEHAQVFATAPLPADDAAAGVRVRRVEFGGRTWELRLWPRAELGNWTQLWLILASGSAISVLLALFLWSQGATQRRAVDLGRKMSARFGESEARFRVLNELLPALVLLAGAGDGRIIHANHAARTQLGRVAGMRLDALFADPALGAQALAAVADDGHWDSREAVVLNGIGAGLWVHAALARVEVDAAPHLLMVATDTSAQREMTERLRYQATHDELTGLCNRREFERQLRQALMNRAGRLASEPFALMYIDLDQFKIINDLSGHMAGDQLLVQLGQAMRGGLRHGGSRPAPDRPPAHRPACAATCWRGWAAMNSACWPSTSMRCRRWRWPSRCAAASSAPPSCGRAVPIRSAPASAWSWSTATGAPSRTCWPGPTAPATWPRTTAATASACTATTMTPPGAWARWNGPTACAGRWSRTGCCWTTRKWCSWTPRWRRPSTSSCCCACATKAAAWCCRARSSARPNATG
ncbi:hypothetical protein STPYR_12026 [uncultured Stenotrophomonas sp.]|uniref:CHASE domain-containing protein n=1 Tax=uncultured Stenotrophomonas sp. TaxID=165438 RepID=A0A1Y5Q7Z1_9GAMM|nr:hypothetical protein STPYR_12026 [uncultured Stenotrophomonas sp.]